MRGRVSSQNLFNHLILQLLQRNPYIINSLLGNLNQNRGQLRQGSIMRVIEPALNKNSIIRLQLEILRNIIHNNNLRQVSSKLTQVLNKKVSLLLAVLSIKPVLDVLISIELIQDPVRILFVNYIL